MNVIVDKQAIINSFSQQAAVYEKYANVQQRNAEQLDQFIQRKADEFVTGPVLEIGCGTGIFTRRILKRFPERALFISDISNAMLQQCAENIAATFNSNTVEFIQLDAESFSLNEKFAVIIASFSLQWVSDFNSTITHLLNHLLPGGQLVVSVPTDKSFEEWRAQCHQSQVPYTANDLPNHTDFLQFAKTAGLSVDWMLNDLTCDFDSSMTFFKSLKGVGASVTTHGQTLSGAQLRKLTKSWDADSKKSNRYSADGEKRPAEISVTYSVLCARITQGSAE